MIKNQKDYEKQEEVLAILSSYDDIIPLSYNPDDCVANHKKHYKMNAKKNLKGLIITFAVGFKMSKFESAGWKLGGSAVTINSKQITDNFLAISKKYDNIEIEIMCCRNPETITFYQKSHRNSSIQVTVQNKTHPEEEGSTRDIHSDEISKKIPIVLHDNYSIEIRDKESNKIIDDQIFLNHPDN